MAAAFTHNVRVEILVGILFFNFLIYLLGKEREGGSQEPINVICLKAQRFLGPAAPGCCVGKDMEGALCLAGGSRLELGSATCLFQPHERHAIALSPFHSGFKKGSNQ